MHNWTHIRADNCARNSKPLLLATQSRYFLRKVLTLATHPFSDTTRHGQQGVGDSYYKCFDHHAYVCRIRNIYILACVFFCHIWVVISWWCHKMSLVDVTGLMFISLITPHSRDDACASESQGSRHFPVHLLTHAFVGLHYSVHPSSTMIQAFKVIIKHI